MRVITEKQDYPNMTPDEIVKSGVALGGDALTEFMRASSEDAQEQEAESNRIHRESCMEEIRRGISILEDAIDDL